MDHFSRIPPALPTPTESMQDSSPHARRVTCSPACYTLDIRYVPVCDSSMWVLADWWLRSDSFWIWALFRADADQFEAQQKAVNDVVTPLIAGVRTLPACASHRVCLLGSCTGWLCVL